MAAWFPPLQAQPELHSRIESGQQDEVERLLKTLLTQYSRREKEIPLYMLAFGTGTRQGLHCLLADVWTRSQAAKIFLRYHPLDLL